MPRSRKNKGDDIEEQVRSLLVGKRWLGWRPPKAKFTEQDVWGAFDILAIRFDSRILGAQTSTLTHLYEKRKKVVNAMGAVLQHWGAVPNHLAMQVWVLIERPMSPRMFRVDEFIRGKWAEIGRCTWEGEMVEGHTLPWPLHDSASPKSAEFHVTFKPPDASAQAAWTGRGDSTTTATGQSTLSAPPLPFP